MYDGNILSPRLCVLRCTLVTNYTNSAIAALPSRSCHKAAHAKRQSGQLCCTYCAGRVHTIKSRACGQSSARPPSPRRPQLHHDLPQRPCSHSGCGRTVLDEGYVFTSRVYFISLSGSIQLSSPCRPRPRQPSLQQPPPRLFRRRLCSPTLNLGLRSVLARTGERRGPS
jgi:hypothetical protein